MLLCVCSRSIFERLAHHRHDSFSTGRRKLSIAARIASRLGLAFQPSAKEAFDERNHHAFAITFGRERGHL